MSHITDVYVPCRTLICIASSLNLVGWASFFFVYNALFCLVPFFFVTTTRCGCLVLEIRILALLILW